jgi:hypothetical protein
LISLFLLDVFILFSCSEPLWFCFHSIIHSFIHSFIHYNLPISSYFVINLSSSICIFWFFLIFMFCVLSWLYLYSLSSTSI